MTNFAALGWRFKCVSHLVWLYFNSRRVQLGDRVGNGYGNGNGRTDTDISAIVFFLYMVWESVLFITFAFAAVFFLH